MSINFKASNGLPVFKLEPVKMPTAPNDVKIATPGWIGVDLDGTLAQYDTWKGWEYIGEPVAKTVERIKLWRKLGVEVRIVTARMAPESLRMDGVSAEAMKKTINAWCVKHLGFELPVTPYKDHLLIFILDDKAVQVRANTGDAVGGDAAFQEFEEGIKKAIDIRNQNEQLSKDTINEVDRTTLSGTMEWNKVTLLAEQVAAFCAGLKYAGFDEAKSPEDWRGSQYLVYASKPDQISAFNLNTVTYVQDQVVRNLLVVRVKTQNGYSDTYVELQNLNYLALGRYCGSKALA